MFCAATRTNHAAGIDYPTLSYGSSLGFATAGTNVGHDGQTGESLMNSEVFTDYAWRGIHLEAVLGYPVVLRRRAVVLILYRMLRRRTAGL
jgi:hypothetical protein